MSVFGDDDPEDAWSASDPVLTQLANLIQRIRWIRDHITAPIVEAHAVRLEDDLSFIRDRVRSGDLD